MYRELTEEKYWVKQDLFLSHEMARPSIEKCPNGKLIMIKDPPHWVQHGKAEEVNQLMEAFIQE